MRRKEGDLLFFINKNDIIVIYTAPLSLIIVFPR